MKTLLNLLFPLALFFLVLPAAGSQVLPTDSLALVAIFNATGGSDWTDNTNWLSGPVPTWQGVTVASNRVTGLDLGNNNLQGDLPADLNDLGLLQNLALDNNVITAIPDLSALTFLQNLALDNNQLTRLPALGVSVLNTLNCAGNLLTFGDLEPFVTGLVVINFTYAPQAPVGEARNQYVSPGAGTTLEVPVDGSSNFYTWFKDGTRITSASAAPELAVAAAGPDDEGDYFVEITNTLLPDLTLSSLPISLILTERDGFGGEFVPNQLIVEFAPDATQFEKDTLLAFFQAERLDVCLCGVVELWELPDTSFLPGGDILIGVEETKTAARSKSEVEDAGNNYILPLLAETTYASKQKDYPIQATSRARKNEVVPVAVIDVGIDYTHPALSDYQWINPGEIENGEDNDGNCLADDTGGYDFANRDTDPIDLVSGHGTHVAGIIRDGLAANQATLIPIKSHRDDGGGLLFNALCGIYYASQQGARVINLSWGYRGAPSSVLESAIRRAGNNCGSLVVASAGNEAADNDATPHYPSSFDLPNLIAVAALNVTEDGLADFSNFGFESVGLAAPGTRIQSTLPGGGYGFKSGTSMAAAAVSGAAANLFYQVSKATPPSVKNALEATAAPLASLEGKVASGGALDLLAAIEYLQNAPADNSCRTTPARRLAAGPEPGVKAFPQPFTEGVTFEIQQKYPQEVWLTIFDGMGRPVFFQYEQHGSQNPLFWNGRSAAGQPLPPGLYLARVQTGNGAGTTLKLLKQ